MSTLQLAHNQDREMDPKIKPLPINVEMEQQLLGAVMVNNDAFHLISDFLEPHHFFEPLHRQIFKVMADMIRATKRVTPISLKTFLPEDEKISDMTVATYLVRLASSPATIANVPDWAQGIVVLWGRRATIGASEQLAIDARDQHRLLSLTFEDHARAILEIENQMQDEEEILTLAQGMSRQVQNVANAYKNDKGQGLDTGVPAIDRLTGPWFPGQLIIIGGSTKMGKTSLGMQALIGMAAHSKVLIFSMEMSASELAARELSKRAGVSTYRQNLGKVNDSEFEKLEAQTRQAVDQNITIVGQSVTLDMMEKIILREKKRNNISAVMVDHIGLIEPDKSQFRMSSWEQGEIATKRMKKMATRHDVAMIGMSQLKKNSQHQGYNNRDFKTKLNSAFSRPKYSDLIGGVERDAHHVILPFRPEALLGEMEPVHDTEDWTKWDEAISKERGKARIVLALSRDRQWPKQENVLWNGKETRFYDEVVEERFL